MIFIVSNLIIVTSPCCLDHKILRDEPIVVFLIEEIYKKKKTGKKIFKENLLAK